MDGREEKEMVGESLRSSVFPSRPSSPLASSIPSSVNKSQESHEVFGYKSRIILQPSKERLEPYFVRRRLLDAE